MHRSKGFTIVEIIVVIVILVILMALGTYSVINSQGNARDSERDADISSIARGLETRYRQGNPRASAPYIVRGAYPGVNEMLHILGNSDTTITPNQITGGYPLDALPGVSIAQFSPPKSTAANYGDFRMTCTAATAPCDAEDMVKLNTLVTKGTYYYEPITVDKKVCMNTECVRFNLYYKKDTDATNSVQIVRSSHQ